MTGSIHEPSTITFFGTCVEDGLTARVRGEYQEMPGMRLTIEQAMRMWMLDRDTCNKVFATLVAAHYLEQDRNGRYARSHGGY